MLVGMKRLIVVSTLVAALAVPATAGTASGTQPAAKKAAATATAKAKAKRSAAKAKAARGAHGSGTCPFKSQAPSI